MPAQIAELIRTKRSISDNIAQDLRQKIENGAYPVGSRLPGRRDLASKYKVAPIIIQKAVNGLVASGLVRAENGRGTFVARADALPQTRLGTVGIITYVYPSWKGEGVRVERATTIMHSLERALTLAGGNSVFFNRYRQDGAHVPLRVAVDEVRMQGAESIVFVLEQDPLEFQYIAQASRKPVPMAAILWDEAPLPVPTVYYDSVNAGRGAASHLVDCGCRRIVFFSSVVATWSERRILGAREVIEAAGPDYSLDVRVRASRDIPNALIDVDYEGEAREFAERVFDEGVEFDGVLAANDRIAVQFVDVARERGLRVGSDYALVGFDNDHESRDAGLSSMQPPWQQMGQEAIQLLQRMRDDPAARQDVQMQSHLIVRQSTLFGALHGEATAKV
ncbi:MAG: substrate-binding domain-containing protein [Capsulimonadaceae bacterium]|nr:substrate-binding domain-containing protein [Capsulimonadaceae bacterium]